MGILVILNVSQKEKNLKKLQGIFNYRKANTAKSEIMNVNLRLIAKGLSNNSLLVEREGIFRSSLKIVGHTFDVLIG
jgi:hypothetical protein